MVKLARRISTRSRRADRGIRIFAALNTDKLLIVESAEPNNVFRVASTVGTGCPYTALHRGKQSLPIWMPQQHGASFGGRV